MSQTTVTIGQAIDQILSALDGFDQKSRETIIATVSAHLGVSAANAPVATSQQTQSTDDERGHQREKPRKGRAMDVRTLKEEKQPKSAVQMACIVAYYLSEHASPPDGKNTIKTEDLEKYFKQAGYRLPQKLNQVLVDAKAGGYFDSATRGEYKLNAVRYILKKRGVSRSMAATPEEAVDSVEAAVGSFVRSIYTRSRHIYTHTHRQRRSA